MILRLLLSLLLCGTCFAPVLVQPYRFAAFSPASISGLQLWLVGDTESAGSVATWDDQSGNGNNATASGVNQPTAVANDLNGHTTVEFDGSNDYLSVADTSGLSLHTDFTVVAVIRYDTISLNVAIVSKDAAAASAGAMFYLLNSAGILQVDRPYVEAGVAATTAVSSATWAVVSVTVSGTSVSHFLNGAANGTDTLANGTDVLPALKVGAFSDGTLKYYLDGKIAELMIYNTPVSASDLDALEDYLGDKYGIMIP